MNDEIKEILSNDNIHIIECDKNWCNAYGYEKSQLKEDLLNYITNLQEENEDLKDRLKVMEHFKNSLLEENERLKFWLNDVIFDDNNNDVELPARYLRKLGYIDFDDEKQVYINKHNNEPFLQKEYKEKVFSLKDDELDDYTKQLEYKFKKVIEYCDNNMEFTPRLIDVKNILGGDEE